MWLYTTIIHPVRQYFNLTEREYCIIDTIAQLSANPSASKAGWCNASNITIAKWLGSSPKTVIAAIEKGKKIGLLDVEEQGDGIPTLKRATKKWFEVVNTLLPKVTPPVTKGNTPLLPKVTPPVTKGNTDNNIDIDIDTNKNDGEFDNSQPQADFDSPKKQENQEKEKSSAKKEKEVPHLVDFEKAVQLLNENSGRSFLVTDLDRKGKTDKYKKFAGLMAKGYVFEDIAAVIVEKCKEWRNDSKMNKYLQPATLFGSVKFEQYLEAVKAGEPNATKISTNSPLNDFHAKAQQRGFVGSIASLGRIFNRIKSKLPPDKTPEYALQRLEAFLNNAGTNDLEQINKKFDSILLKLKQNATTKNASTTQ